MLSTHAFQNGTEIAQGSKVSDLQLRAKRTRRLESWDNPLCMHSQPRVADDAWSGRRKLFVILVLNTCLWGAVLGAVALIGLI
jgi:hypothetical protein